MKHGSVEGRKDSHVLALAQGKPAFYTAPFEGVKEERDRDRPDHDMYTIAALKKPLQMQLISTRNSHVDKFKEICVEPSENQRKDDKRREDGWERSPFDHIGSRCLRV